MAFITGTRPRRGLRAGPGAVCQLRAPDAPATVPYDLNNRGQLTGAYNNPNPGVQPAARHRAADAPDGLTTQDQTPRSPTDPAPQRRWPHDLTTGRP